MSVYWRKETEHKAQKVEELEQVAKRKHMESFSTSSSTECAIYIHKTWWEVYDHLP